MTQCGYAIPFHCGYHRCNCILCALIAVSCAIRRRKDQKDLFYADANPNSAQKEKIGDNKKRIGVAFADSVEKKEIRLPIADRVSDGEGKKEVFAHPGAQRNAIANSGAFSFTNRNGSAGKRKARCAERDFVTGSDQWFRELSAESAATSQFGARTHHPQS